MYQMRGEIRNVQKIWSKNENGRNHLEGTGVEEMTLKFLIELEPQN